MDTKSAQLLLAIKVFNKVAGLSLIAPPAKRTPTAHSSPGIHSASWTQLQFRGSSLWLTTPIILEPTHTSSQPPTFTYNTLYYHGHKTLQCPGQCFIAGIEWFCVWEFKTIPAFDQRQQREKC